MYYNVLHTNLFYTSPGTNVHQMFGDHFDDPRSNVDLHQAHLLQPAEIYPSKVQGKQCSTKPYISIVHCFVYILRMSKIINIIHNPYITSSHIIYNSVFHNISSLKQNHHCATIKQKKQITPPKINIEPENDGLEDVSPFPGVYSQVPC